MISDLLTAPITAVFYTLILWWFTTGLIMAVFQRSQRTIRICFGVATLVMLAALFGLGWSARDVRPVSVYLAVTCGTIVWGWHVASYYLGFVTGIKPSQHNYLVQNAVEPAELYQLNRSSQGQAEKHIWHSALQNGLWLLFPPRFRQAALASLYHELFVLACFLIMAAITLPLPNRWGLWIYLALWLMHTSAKLNIFFGVRNFRVDFLPQHLHFLEQFVAKQRISLFFPLSICVAFSLGLFLLYQVIDPNVVVAHSIGATLILTMVLLGILEHLMLILPIPVALWGWGVRPLPEQTVEG